MDNLFIGAIRVVANVYMPGPQMIRHAAKGPYRRRREKRLALNPLNWRWPSQYMILVDGTYHCHPYTYEALKRAVAETWKCSLSGRFS